VHEDRDRETARLLLRQDPEGLRRLLADHAGRVRFTLRREFFKVLDEQQIDDALSQASQRAWRAGHRFDPTRGTLRAWFYVIARNCALRQVENRKRDKVVQFVDDVDWVQLQQHTATATADPPDIPKQRDPFIEDFYRCVDSLPPQQRAVVMADLQAGGTAPAQELAADLNTTTNSIYVSRTNARKTLRATLLAKGHEFPMADGLLVEGPMLPPSVFQHRKGPGGGRAEVAQ
jgi:RNA polymerase sigma factor (sigma-70 family)